MKKSLIGLYCTFVFYLTTHAQTGRTPGGMYYEIYPSAQGDPIKIDQVIKCWLVQKVGDSLMFSTGDKIPIYQRVQKEMPYDISEVWQRMKTGDSVYAVQLMDTFIKRRPEQVPPVFKKGDSIKTFVRVLEVFETDSLGEADYKKEQDMLLQKEMRSIESELASKNIKVVRTPSGAFVEQITTGTGPSIANGDKISVNYKAMTWDGKVFDSNVIESFGHVEPYEFIVGAGEMIKGFDESVIGLTKGATIKTYVPSMLAYAGNPPPGGPVAPYMNLVFEISIVAVGK